MSIEILTRGVIILLALWGIWIIFRLAGRAFARSWKEEMETKKEKEDGSEEQG